MRPIPKTNLLLSYTINLFRFKSMQPPPLLLPPGTVVESIKEEWVAGSCVYVSTLLLGLYSFASDAEAANGVCLHCVVVECRSSSEHRIPILACAGSRNTVGGC